MAQHEHIEAIEKRLWSAADTLWTNSNYASNEYFLPVMGLVFLRHAYSRFLGVKDATEAGLPTRGGKIGHYLDLVAGYCRRMLTEGAACFTMKDDEGETVEPLPDFIGALATLRSSIEPFLKTLAEVMQLAATIGKNFEELGI